MISNFDIFTNKNFWDIKSRGKTQIWAHLCISHILFAEMDAKGSQGGNWPFLTIFEISRFLTSLRKSPKCAMKVAYTPNESFNLVWSGARDRHPSYFVDFAQILIKNRKFLIFRPFSKNLVDAAASTKIEKIFASTELWIHSGYISYSRWSRMTPLEGPHGGFISIYPQFNLKKTRC